MDGPRRRAAGYRRLVAGGTGAAAQSERVDPRQRRVVRRALQRRVARQRGAARSTWRRTTSRPAPDAHGTLSQTLAQSVDEGETLALTVIPDIGYHLDTVSGCGGTLAGIHFHDRAGVRGVHGDGDVRDQHATPSRRPPGSHGTIAPAGTQTVDHGETRAFTVARGDRLSHRHGDRLRRYAQRGDLHHGACRRGMHGRREFRGRSAPTSATADRSTADRSPPSDPPPSDPPPSTPPPATYTRYFAEGASNDFFATRLAVLNPNDAAATVLVTSLRRERSGDDHPARGARAHENDVRVERGRRPARRHLFQQRGVRSADRRRSPDDMGRHGLRQFARDWRRSPRHDVVSRRGRDRRIVLALLPAAEPRRGGRDGDRDAICCRSRLRRSSRPTRCRPTVDSRST